MHFCLLLNMLARVVYRGANFHAGCPSATTLNSA